jgi:parallel beta-helix repeat protein
MKSVIVMILIVVLIGMLGLSFKVQKIEASGTIYIRADGSVGGTTHIVSSDNVTYVFTADINDSIVVERSNIVIDGSGYTLQRTQAYDSKGMCLNGINNVTIKNINIKKFQNGIWFSFSSNNNVAGNNITANTRSGIGFYCSSNNSVTKNNITANTRSGVWLSNSSDNSMSGNRIVATSGNGIWLYYSSNNSVSGNNITNNTDGIWLSDSSSNNSIIENNITANSYDGIGLGSSDNSISGNNITINRGGIWFSSSSNTSIIGNNIIANKVYSISIDSESTGNMLFHNNFINNSVHSENSMTIWDDGYPSGGNYWSDYSGTDFYNGPYQNETGSDGIGDTKYTIDVNNVDKFPLMAPFNTFDAGTWSGVTYNVDVVSNSTVSDFYFNPVEGAFIRFNVTGKSGTAGFCRATIPKNLLWVEDGWTVLMGGEPITNYTIISDENCTYLYFTYNHSTKTVIIQGTHVIPEFPSFLILPLFMIATMLAVIVYKRKHSV